MGIKVVVSAACAGGSRVFAISRRLPKYNGRSPEPTLPMRGVSPLPVDSPVCWRSVDAFWLNALMEFRQRLGMIFPYRKCVYQTYEKHRRNYFDVGRPDQRSFAHARHASSTPGQEFHLYAYEVLAVDN